MAGRLYICGTPIGNLEDMSPRLVRVLSEVDLVAAEDTRHTRKLLDRAGIGARLVSHHDANENKQIPWLIARLKAGDDVALVSDAGMPSISDPGYRLVTEAIDNAIALEVVPGPSAVISALVVSGLPTARFSFEGFLPRRTGDATRRLAKIASDDRTLIFFEAANRVPATLTLLAEALSDRRAAVARELTKIHEEVLRGKLTELIERCEDLKGEVVILVEGAPQKHDLDAAVSHARALIEAGRTKSRAAAEAASEFGVTRKLVYEALVKEG